MLLLSINLRRTEKLRGHELAQQNPHNHAGCYPEAQIAFKEVQLFSVASIVVCLIVSAIKFSDARFLPVLHTKAFVTQVVTSAAEGMRPAQTTFSLMTSPGVARI